MYYQSVIQTGHMLEVLMYGFFRYLNYIQTVGLTIRTLEM